MKYNIRKISSPEEMRKCTDIRIEVFINGQSVPKEIEIDGKDDECEHYLLELGNLAIGTARVQHIESIAKIERVAILKKHQGHGFGKKLMEYVISDLSKSAHVKKLKLGSQTQAIPFYESLGFKICSDEYMDAGIAHKYMEMKLGADKRTYLELRPRCKR